MSPSPYALALELTVLLAVWLGLGAWQNDRQWPGRGCFLGLTLALAVWSFGAVVGDRELVPHFGAEKIRYLGMMAAPALWFGLGAQALRLPLARRVPWLPAALMAPSLCLYLLFHLGPWTALFVHPDGPGSTDVGPLHAIHLAYSWLLVAGGSALMVKGALEQVEQGRIRRRIHYVAAALLPLLMPTLALVGGARWSQDPAPLLLAAALLALRGALFRGGLFDAVPVDQRDLMRHLQIGLVVADASGAVIDLNPAAERCLGITHAQALDRNLEAVLARLAHEVPVEIQPILVGGRLKGSCAVISDPAPRLAA